jgi:BirA family transcriptional regulator, biotin operon repressor / biotin---[acetyl-CoA-carboxylase] ligase
MDIIKNQKGSVAKHIHFQTIDSTNTWAKLHNHEWSLDGLTLITAGTQTGGRGRFKRHWLSPPDVNIYATFCFWMECSFFSIGYVPQLLALAAAHVLDDHGFNCTLKWPNDVLLHGKKIAGILCEVISEDNKKGIVCGIGLNVNMTPEELNTIDRPATSLFATSGNIFSVSAILESLQSKFGAYLQNFLIHGFSPFFSEIIARSYHKKGDKVRFHTNREIVIGTFHSWESNGTVAIANQNKSIQYFHAGEFIEE